MTNVTREEVESVLTMAGYPYATACRFDLADEFEDWLVGQLRLCTEGIGDRTEAEVAADTKYMHRAMLITFALAGATVMRGRKTGSVNLQHIRQVKP